MYVRLALRSPCTPCMYARLDDAAQDVRPAGRAIFIRSSSVQFVVRSPGPPRAMPACMPPFEVERSTGTIHATCTTGKYIYIYTCTCTASRAAAPKMYGITRLDIRARKLYHIIITSACRRPPRFARCTAQRKGASAGDAHSRKDICTDARCTKSPVQKDSIRSRYLHDIYMRVGSSQVYVVQARMYVRQRHDAEIRQAARSRHIRAQKDA